MCVNLYILDISTSIYVTLINVKINVVYNEEEGTAVESQEAVMQPQEEQTDLGAPLEQSELKEKPKKKRHIFLKIVTAVIVVAAVSLITAAVLFANKIYTASFTTKTTISRAETETPEEIANRWVVKNSEDVYIESFDGLKLHGLFCENSGDEYVIICHGYKGRATRSSKSARGFYKMGFNVLAIDERAHGESEGSFTSFGFYEKRDLLSWINSINSSNPNAKIVLYGTSMGASTVLLATACDELPDNIICAIEDSGYANAEEVIYKNSLKFGNFPEKPIMALTGMVAKLRGGFSFKDTDCVEAVKKSKTPTLFLHGGKDTVVSSKSLDLLYNAASCEKSKLLFRDALHAKLVSFNPELYWTVVGVFISQARELYEKNDK